MSKVTYRKPGPKSKTSRIIQHGTLGESSDSDDNSSDETADNEFEESESTHSSINNNSQSEFATPVADKDATDYGLEFTSSQVSPRRCSTLRSALGSQQQQSDASIHYSAKKTSKVKENPPEKVAKHATKSKETTENQGTGSTKVVRKRRKQNPLKIERRFWKEVEELQKRNNLIPMLPFSRLVREIMLEVSSEVTKITPTALEALQTSSELYITQRLQDAYMLTLHRGRVTLDVRDMELIKYLQIK